MEEPNKAEWQAPPPPEGPAPEKEQPEMSEIGTVVNIFFEPGRTFEDLRRKPRFIIAGLIMIALITAFAFVFSAKIGPDAMKRFISQQIDKSPQAAGISPEQRNQSIQLQMTIQSIIRYVLPVFIIIGFLLGALLYWLGAKAMGGEMSFTQSLSVWIYSSLPPTVIGILANFIVLFLKPADQLDIAESQRGLVHANPSFFIDSKAMPVVATLLSVIDLFQIWGWILAAIGLRKVGKLSSASAWTIVFILALIGVAFRVFGAVMSGNPS
jgi:membrane protein, antimicrobial resistance system